MDTIQTYSQDTGGAICTVALSKHEGVQHHAAPNRGNHMRTAAHFFLTEIKNNDQWYTKKSASVLTMPSIGNHGQIRRKSEAKFECIVGILHRLHCYNTVELTG